MRQAEGVELGAEDTFQQQSPVWKCYQPCKVSTPSFSSTLNPQSFKSVPRLPQLLTAYSLVKCCCQPPTGWSRKKTLQSSCFPRIWEEKSQSLAHPLTSFIVPISLLLLPLWVEVKPSLKSEMLQFRASSTYLRSSWILHISLHMLVQAIFILQQFKQLLVSSGLGFQMKHWVAAWGLFTEIMLFFNHFFLRGKKTTKPGDRQSSP